MIVGIREAAFTNPEKTAIVMIERGESRTFRELAERTYLYAKFLAAWLRGSHNIALKIEKCPGFLVICFGAMSKRCRELTIMGAICPELRNNYRIR